MQQIITVLKALVFETFLARLKETMGTTVYQSLLVKNENGEVLDVTQGGELSCATFVSNFLLMFDAISRPCATVKSTQRELKEKGWYVVDVANRKIGDIIVWDYAEQLEATLNMHIGFYVEKDTVISNSTSKKVPNVHHYTYNGTREIVEVLRFDKWEEAFEKQESKQKI